MISKLYETLFNKRSFQTQVATMSLRSQCKANYRTMKAYLVIRYADLHKPSFSEKWKPRAKFFMKKPAAIIYLPKALQKAKERYSRSFSFKAYCLILNGHCTSQRKPSVNEPLIMVNAMWGSVKANLQPGMFSKTHYSVYLSSLAHNIDYRQFFIVWRKCTQYSTFVHLTNCSFLLNQQIFPLFTYSARTTNSAVARATAKFRITAFQRDGVYSCARNLLAQQIWFLLPNFFSPVWKFFK